MAQPQRGQVVALPRQVVPQEEQVLAAQVAPVLLTQVGVQPVLQPLLQLGLQPQPRLAAATVLSGQADCGKSGRLKNSSHTFSANSSQGSAEAASISSLDNTAAFSRSRGSSLSAEKSSGVKQKPFLSIE